MRNPILKADKSYAFSDYCELSQPTEEVIAELGYQFEFTKLDLPQKSVQSESLTKIRQTLYKKLPRISLTSEAAKREFLVAPILYELLDYVDMRLDVEYPVDVNDKLHGTIDYVLRAKQNFIIVEAKNADLERGFTHLAVELIAMEKYLEVSESPQLLLYGAVTMGDTWRFGMLARGTQLIVKDINLFTVPTNLEVVFSVLLGILNL